MAEGQKSITIQEELYDEVKRCIHNSTYKSVAEFVKHWIRIGLNEEFASEQLENDRK